MEALSKSGPHLAAVTCKCLDLKQVDKSFFFDKMVGNNAALRRGDN